MADSRILLGVIGRPHGVRGLVHVHSYTAEPGDLADYAPLVDSSDPAKPGRRFVLRWHGEGIARIAELAEGREVPVQDRTAAERLTNVRLYVDRDRLPEPDGDEFYLNDLVGLQALAPDGAALGRVAVVHDYGAGPSLEIVRETAPALLVPFTHACVPVVEIAAGRLTVVMPDEVVGEPSDKEIPEKHPGAEAAE